ncbi:MAG TPA: bifunctional diaminohydroxyphosphoribosylaminopyrimidine deaminase/5-amino-6-(5-phosphoribosylamino)uracil reductase RibD [Spirochaetota bacterium]|nr:bifunctional diaminohydroxyphosphoribosylaminopyrimidine deaminase/5-amino-6-(5-phosphoribosylamino)uracil reductase RibD [Spirochaetota bacterium]
MSNYNSIYMRKAFEAAFSRCGYTSPNPPVGALVVKDGRIISSGGTQFCGGDHAEVCAINSAGEDSFGSELYVTLEPCSHHGKTPPCTDKIISSGIKRVYLPILDCNPKVSGNGVRILKENGIDVVIADDFKDYAIDMYRPFFTLIENKRSYLIHKSAVTLDGYIADADGSSKWISNEISRYISHRLRALNDAVIIGKNTLLADNPSLDVRLNDFNISGFDFKNVLFSGYQSGILSNLFSRNELCSSQPLRVVVGYSEKYNRNMNFFRDNNFIIYETKEYDTELFAEFLKLGRIRILSEKDFFENILSDLASIGIMSAMLEGGGHVSGGFLNEDVIDEEYLFIAPKIFIDGKKAFAGSIPFNNQTCKKLFDISSCSLNDDLLYHAYYRKRSDVYRNY